MKNCKLYVGTGSGPDALAINFQKPIVLIGYIYQIYSLFKVMLSQYLKKFITKKKKNLLNLKIF